MSQRDNVQPLFVGVDLAKVGCDNSAVVLNRNGRIVLGAGAGGPAVIDPDWINALQAGRKPEREQLALAAEAIALAHGATVERETEGRHPGWHSGSISLRIKLNGVGATVDFSNLHGGKHGLIHWYNDYSESRDTRNFAGAFKAAVSSFGSGSPHKATTSSDNWQGLAKALDAGLCLASRGEAFAPSAP